MCEAATLSVSEPNAGDPVAIRRCQWTAKQLQKIIATALSSAVALFATDDAIAGDGATPVSAVYAHDLAPPDRVAISKPGRNRVEALLSYYKGAYLETKGNLSGAQDALESTLTLDPANLRLANRIARISAALNEHQHGLQVLRDSLEKNPETPDAYLSVSRFCENLATRLEKAAIDAGDEDEDALDQEVEASMLRVQGQATAQQAVEKFPSFTPAYWQLLRTYLAQNRKDLAQQMLEKAVQRDETSPAYWLQMGQLAQQAWPLADREHYQAHLDTINGLYERALSESADDPQVADSVADHFSQTRQYDRAVSLYQKVIEQRPDMLLTREKLARVFGVLERHDDKLDALRELVSINPHSIRVQKFIASELQGRGDERGAIDHYLAAIKAGESDPIFYHQLVELMLRQGMVTEALPVLKRARFLHPEAVSIGYLLAQTFSQLEQWEEAMRTFRATEKQAEDTNLELLNDEFYYHYATTARGAGKLPRAATLFRKSIANVPRKEQHRAAKSYNMLATMWLEEGTKIAEAGQLIVLANDLEPDQPAYLDTLGWFHFAKGDVGKAITTLERAVALPDAPEAIHERLKRYREVASTEQTKTETQTPAGSTETTGDAHAP